MRLLFPPTALATECCWQPRPIITSSRLGTSKPTYQLLLWGQARKHIVPPPHSRVARMKMRDHCCCCHVLTAAAIVGMLQLIVIVLTMSSAGIILDRWTDWEEWYDSDDMKDMLKKEFEAALPTTPPPTGTPLMSWEPPPEPEAWAGALMEIELAHQIGICAIWLLALGFYAGAFKYYKAVFVLPNYILTVIALVSTIFGIIALSIRLGDPKGLKKNAADIKEHRDVILGIFLASAVIFMIVEIIFVAIIHKLYKYLQDMAGLVFPGVPSVSLPMKPSGLEDSLA